MEIKKLRNIFKQYLGIKLNEKAFK